MLGNTSPVQPSSADAGVPARGEVLRALLGVLDRDNSLSRCCAVKALGRIDARDGESKQRLIALLRDPDPDVRMDTAAVLGRLAVGEATEPLLANVENDPEGDVRIEAVKALRAIGAPRAVERLLRCIQQEGYPQLDLSRDDLEYGACFEVRSQALEALGAIGDARATEPLIAFLEDEDHEDIQESGYRVLAQLDDGRAQAFLCDQIRKGARLARRRAVRALAAWSGMRHRELPPAIVNALTNALVDTDPDVRISAARALADADSAQAAVPLTLLLTDPDEEVRAEVAALLGKLRGWEVVDRIHALLAESEPRVRRRVVQALGDIGAPASMPPLAALLDEQDSDLVHDVVEALGKIRVAGPEAEIAAHLANTGAQRGLRIQAARALGRLLANRTPEGPGDETAGPPAAAAEPEESTGMKAPLAILERSVFDADAGVRYAALEALVEMAPEAATARLLSTLAEDAYELHHGSSQPAGDASPAPVADEERETGQEARESQRALQEHAAGDPAASTLASILDAQPRTEEAPASAPPMRLPRQTTEESVQVLAARLLGDAPDPEGQVVDALMVACEREQPELHREALLSLGRIADERAMPAVIKGLDADNRDLRLAALEALGGFGGGFSGGADAQACFAALVHDPDPVLRQRALQALAAHLGPKAVDYVFAGLADVELDVCRAALAAVSPRMHGGALTERVVGLLFSFSAELRRDAAAALSRLKDASVVGRLLAILDDPRQEENHWICIDALAEMFAQEAPGRTSSEQGSRVASGSGDAP